MASAFRSRSVIVALGGGASVVFMFLAARRLDFEALQRAILSIDVWPYVPLAVLSYVCGHLVRGVRCKLLLRRDASLSVATAANVVVVGYAANNVFPARLGELVRAGMLSERTGIPIVQSLTVTLIERVLDGLAILSLLLLGVSAGHSPVWARELATVAVLVFGVALAGAVLAAHAPGLLVAAASRASSRLTKRWHDRLVRLTTSIVSAGACLRNPRDAGLLVGYSLLVWVFEAGMFIALLPAFGLAPHWAAGAVAMSVTNLGLLVPSTPGFIGPFHYFCSQALLARGVDPAVALAYATVVHLTFYVPVTLWGAGAMLWYGVEVGATASVVRAAQSSSRQFDLKGIVVHEVAHLEGPAAPTSASKFTRTLVEALVAGESQEAAPATVERAAAFVHGQVQALPRRLALLLEGGMIMFRAATRVRFARGYCDLSLESRRAWTNTWANGRYPLLRKLFKPLRATALLAYHEEVVERSVASSIVVKQTGVLAARQLTRSAGRG